MIAMTYGCTVSNAIRSLDLLFAGPIELKLGVPDVSHVAYTAHALDVEARAYVVNEAVAGRELLRLLIRGLHDVRTVVLVGLAVLGIWLIEINLEVSYIIAG